MDSAKSYETASVLAAPAAQQSPLTALLETQEITASLLKVLAEKLVPVSNPHPTDSKDRQDRGYHIDSALFRQREINDALSYLIDVLLV